MKTINLEIQVPDWVKWVATNDSGDVIGYSAEPTPQDDGWWKLDEGSERALVIGRGKYPKWRESLRKV